MLLLTNTRSPATDLGFLAAKHPNKVQSFELGFGTAHVFYPQADDERCTMALLLDIDPIGLVRGKGSAEGVLDAYVNDRPYVASSFLSVAISRVFRSALNGQCRDKPELPGEVLPLEVQLPAVPCRGGETFLRALWEPLGYEVGARQLPLDEAFPAWGESRLFDLQLRAEKKLSELLSHLYVLLPVLDDEKHYFIGDEEVDKLLRRGEGWLSSHPARDEIVSRYLRRQKRLTRDALARLTPDEPDPELETERAEREEETAETRVGLHQQRLDAVLSALKESGARSILDLGCGEGKLIAQLVKEAQFERIVGLDASVRSLEIARRKLDKLPTRAQERVKLLHGALTYRDARLNGFDAATLVEVVEHLDAPRLRAFERVVWEFARPRTVVLTTPNRDYNATWPSLAAGNLRHRDHRFEWTRAEFRTWAENVASRFGYGVRFGDIGPQDEQLGAPTQMAMWTLEQNSPPRHEDTREHQKK